MTLTEVLFASGILVITLTLLAGSMVTLHHANETTMSRGRVTDHLMSVSEHILRITEPKQLTTYTPLQISPLERDEQIKVEIEKPDGTRLALPVSEEQLSSLSFTPVIIIITGTWKDLRGHTLTLIGGKQLYL